jgi:hypothetical protein
MGRLRLQSQLLLSTLLIICALTGAIVLFIRQTVRTQIAAQVQYSTDASIQEFGRVQKQLQSELSRTAALLAEIPTLKALMTTRDAPTIQDGSVPFWKLAGSDLFLLADPSGRVVALDVTQKGLQRDAAAGVGVVVFGRAVVLGFPQADPRGRWKQCQGLGTRGYRV